MRFVKIGIMGLMMLLISNIMTLRVEATTKTDSATGYVYSTDGDYTSMDTPDGVNDNVDLKLYEVREMNSYTGEVDKKQMRNYLVGGDLFYTIPGLTSTNVLGENCETMVPQGICRMDNYILITAYDSEKTYKSVIYVLDVGGELKATLVYDKKCHMGGITYDGKFVWIAEGGNSDPNAPDNGIGAISKNTIFAAVNVSKVKKAKSVKLKNIMWQQVSEITSTSYCTYFDNRLWIGKFSDTGKSHIYGYKIDYVYSTPKLTAERYIEAPRYTQGMCFYKSLGTVFLGISTSYGRDKESVIRCYRPTDYYEPKKKYKGILLIHKGNAYRTLAMPSMSEQISIHGVFMYCIYESAASEYVTKALNPIGSFCIFSANQIFK